MDRYDLDFSLELSHGAIHNLGDLLLLYRIRASTFLPTGEPGKAVIVLRERDWRLTAREVRLPHEATDRLIEMLRALGLPEGHPQVQAAPGNLSGWQGLDLAASLNGVEWAVTLNLQYGGVTGADAQALRELVRYLLGLAGLADEEDRLLIV